MTKHTKREEGHCGKKEREKKEERSGKEKSDKEGAKGQSQEKGQKEKKEEGEKITGRVPNRQQTEGQSGPQSWIAFFYTG